MYYKQLFQTVVQVTPGTHQFDVSDKSVHGTTFGPDDRLVVLGYDMDDGTGRTCVFFDTQTAVTHLVQSGFSTAPGFACPSQFMSRWWSPLINWAAPSQNFEADPADMIVPGATHLNTDLPNASSWPVGATVYVFAAVLTPATISQPLM